MTDTRTPPTPEITAKALRLLADEIQSPDNVPALCLRDAAEMIERLGAAMNDNTATNATNASELREIIASATPGPYNWERGDHRNAPQYFKGGDGTPILSLIHGNDGDSIFPTSSDERLIVAAVNALPGLLDELEELRTKLLEARREVEDAKEERNQVAVEIRREWHKKTEGLARLSARAEELERDLAQSKVDLAYLWDENKRFTAENKRLSGLFERQREDNVANVESVNEYLARMEAAENEASSLKALLRDIEKQMFTPTPDPATLRALLAKATPGQCALTGRGSVYKGGKCWYEDDGTPNEEEDMALIVAAVNALPALLDELDRAKAWLRATTELLNEAKRMAVSFGKDRARLRLQAEIDARKIAEWRLAAELGEELRANETHGYGPGTARYHQAMAKARGEGETL